MKKRILSVLICTSLIVSICGCANNQQQTSTTSDTEAPVVTTTGTTTAPVTTTTPVTTTEPEDEFSLYDIPTEFEDPFCPGFSEINFSDLMGTRYDGIEEFRKAVVRIKEACEEDGRSEEIKELYEFLYNDLSKAGMVLTVTMLERDLDYRNEKLFDDALKAETDYSEMCTIYTEAIIKVLGSDYGEEFRAFMGEDVADSYDTENEITETERLTENASRQSELVSDYLMALQQEYSVQYKGEEWTEAKLIEDMSKLASVDEIYYLLERLLEEKNKACVGYYIDLVALRKEEAAIYGYDNVAEFYYSEGFGRDYTPEEAELFYSSVKKYIVPAYEKIQEMGISPDGEVAPEDILPTMKKILPEISTEMEDIFDYMTDHGMIYLTDDLENCSPSGYCASIDGYSQPVIYNSLYRNWHGISDTFHEFGHYCDSYLNGVYSPGLDSLDYDLAEVSSTGLELLVYDYYDEMFEGNVSDEKLDRLAYTLDSIISGCVFDEAQQRVFEYEGELTPDIVNGIFRDVAEEYGGSDDETYFSYTWVEIPHTFETPFYYISYATSASAALEIWLTAKQDGQEAAEQLYLELLSRGSFEYGYSEALSELGMRGFKSEEFMKELADAVTAEAEELAEDIIGEDAA